MFKKSLLLSAIFTALNICTISAMDPDNNNEIKVILQENESKTKSVLDTLANESKFAAVSAACYGASILGGIALFPKQDSFERVVFAMPILAGSIFVGNKLTNITHESLDPIEKHKTAQVVGFAAAVGCLVASLNYIKPFYAWSMK